MPRTTALRPRFAIPGGRVDLHRAVFPAGGGDLPCVRVGGLEARVVWASPDALGIVVPPDVPGGSVPIRVNDLPGETVFLEVGDPIATGLHQVDSPAFDPSGVLYLTYSGSRGQQTPVSVYRVRPGGVREVFVTGITNPTSLAVNASGELFVSSRFDGTVLRIRPDGRTETFATDLGVACGLAFDPDGTLFVGDRTGTIFRVNREGEVAAFATLPASVAAFHLAITQAGDLYVTGPTLSSRDAVYRVARDGRAEVVSTAFGRPQGLACDPQGRLYVAEALAGASGIYRLDPAEGNRPELVVAGPELIGLAFDPAGAFVVATADAAYRFAARPFA